MSRRLKLLAVLAAFSLLAAACGDDDDDVGAEASTPTSEPSDGEEPTAPVVDDDGGETPEPADGEDSTPEVAGGTELLVPVADESDVCTEDKVGGDAVFGLGLGTMSLDPTKALGSGVAGGTEIAAIYDTLIVFDPSTGSYNPHVAESVVANDELTEWTVTLRSGVVFGNGDPLTTEAVKFSFERMKTASVSSAGLVANITDMELVDDLTIVFTLGAPSASFLYVLAEDAGNIVNPNVVGSMTEDEFSLLPVGAGVGPYEVESFSPGESVVMKAKTDYWGGPVCIDELKFIYVAGAPATFDAFKLGEMDIAFLSNADLQLAEARADGVQMLSAITNGQTVMIFNAGRTGTDSMLQDVRLRQAVAAAIDVDLVNDRVYEGLGNASSALVADSEGWSPGIPGPAYDPELAASLVEELKAEGWDGKLRMVNGDSPPSAIETGIVIQGLLEAVGMDIDVSNLDRAEVNEVVIEKADFDLAFFGISAFEDAPVARYSSYISDSTRNRTGYGSPEMDEAIAILDQALTREEKKAAMVTIQEIWNRDVPSAVINHAEWAVVYSDAVHGLRISRDVTAMFYDAYLTS